VRQNLTKRYVFYKSSKSISSENREDRCKRSPVRWKRGHPFAKEPTNEESLTGQTHKSSHYQDQPNHLLPHSTNQTQSLWRTTPWPIISPSHQPNPNLETQLQIKPTLLVLTPKHPHSCSDMKNTHANSD
jgi:hypothetical protein